jgi:hypothetical protein
MVRGPGQLFQEKPGETRRNTSSDYPAYFLMKSIITQRKISISGFSDFVRYWCLDLLSPILNLKLPSGSLRRMGTKLHCVAVQVEKQIRRNTLLIPGKEGFGCNAWVPAKVHCVGRKMTADHIISIDSDGFYHALP